MLRSILNHVTVKLIWQVPFARSPHQVNHKTLPSPHPKTLTTPTHNAASGPHPAAPTAQVASSPSHRHIDSLHTPTAVQLQVSFTLDGLHSTTNRSTAQQ
jgi:hypothetical protein